jgi:hypothetical protein
MTSLRRRREDGARIGAEGVQQTGGYTRLAKNVGDMLSGYARWQA